MSRRSKDLLLTSSAAMLCVSIFANIAVAQSFDRLPPIYSTAQLERLPNTGREPAVHAPRLDDRKTIRFAGGGIELEIPQQWWAEEVPFGREVRLVMAPHRPVNERRMPNDAMWIAYHAAAAPDRQGEDALTRELSARLQSVIGSREQYAPPTPFQFGPWPAAVAEFTTREPSSTNASIAGRHVMVHTEWGILEFHASAPEVLVESRSKVWTATWESLRLNPPATSSASPQRGPAESNSIIGEWKSYRSRMRFSSDGRVFIVPDAVGGNRGSTVLTGTFEARDDLVFVRWDDGSRLNFRWRLKDNDLFLTDHEGQISHLKRVFN